MVGFGDLCGLVRSSRTFRRFDEAKKITEGELLALIDVARFAPSGNNLQVLRYLVMVDEERVSCCFGHHKWAGLLKDFDGPGPGERPVAYIAILVPKGQGSSPIRNQDAGIAAQTIMLAARTQGLGGCMVKSFDAGLNADLGLDALGYECVLLLALGHPCEEVVLEEATADTGVAYWHDDRGRNHVPKRSVEDLVLRPQE